MGQRNKQKSRDPSDSFVNDSLGDPGSVLLTLKGSVQYR